MIAALIALLAGFLVGRRFKVEVKVSRGPEIPAGVSEARFLLTSKRGRLATNNMAEVSQEITRLRRDAQPFEYYMDGRLVRREGGIDGR